MTDIGKKFRLVTVGGFQFFGIIAQRPVVLGMLFREPGKIGTQLL